jgi:hypothetical protein
MHGLFANIPFLVTITEHISEFRHIFRQGYRARHNRIELASVPRPQKKTINGVVGHNILIFGGARLQRRRAAAT